MPRSDRVRSKKERKILREALKKEGIVAKVSKCGVAYDILVNNDMQKPKLPPIGITFHQNQGLKKEHTNESISDCAALGKRFLNVSFLLKLSKTDCFD